MDELVPMAGEPAGHELNSHAEVRGVGVVLLEPVPLLFSAGADRTT